MSLSCSWYLLFLGTALVGAQYTTEREEPYYPGYPLFNGARDMAGMITEDNMDEINMGAEKTPMSWARLNGGQFPPINPMRKSNPVPQAPTQWQMMLAPFMGVFPDISDYCRCTGMANCGCCVGVSLKPIPFQNNVCGNVSLSQDDYTGSRHMFRAKFHYDRYKLVDVSVSERESPKVCFTAPLIPFGACAQVTNLHFDKRQHKFCACLALSAEYHERSFIQLPVGCICGGRPYSIHEKRGLFGLNLLGLVEKIKPMLG